LSRIRLRQTAAKEVATAVHCPELAWEASSIANECNQVHSRYRSLCDSDSGDGLIAQGRHAGEKTL
jgi:hypothetical protein